MSAAVLLQDEGAPLDLLRLGVLARELEDLLLRLSQAGRIGHVRPAGDARTAMIAAALALEPGDLLFGTARDLPAALARGVGAETILRQAFGKDGDPGLGRGLPGAVVSREHGVTLSDGSASAHLVHAAGFGIASRLRGDDRVALGLFGSAGQASGELHAALNFAAVHGARTVFVARGPLAGEVPFSEAAEAWGLPAVTVPADDGLAVLEAVREARRRAVRGDGPTVVDARSDAPAEPRDALRLRDSGALGEGREARIASEARESVRRARIAAEGAARVSAETLEREVYGS